MKRIKLISLFAFGIPLISSLVVCLFPVIVVTVNFESFDQILGVIALIPFLIMFGLYFLFIPSIFVGVAASLLKFQTRVKNFIYLIIFTFLIDFIYYVIIRPFREDHGIMSFVLLLISSSIIGYFVFLKNKKLTN